MLKRVGDDMAAFLFQTSVKMKLCPSVNGLITTQVADSRHNIYHPLPPKFCENVRTDDDDFRVAPRLKPTKIPPKA